jgi:hypothetical protein
MLLGLLAHIHTAVQQQAIRCPVPGLLTVWSRRAAAMMLERMNWWSCDIGSIGALLQPQQSPCWQSSCLRLFWSLEAHHAV